MTGDLGVGLRRREQIRFVVRALAMMGSLKESGESCPDEPGGAGSSKDLGFGKTTI
jgi:hypothetical protein